MQKVKVVKSLILVAATILFAALLCCIFFEDVGAVAATADYEIYTYDDLVELSNKSKSNTFAGKTIALRNNIIANDTENFENWDTVPPEHIFEPICSFAIDFKGTFLGGGYAISGLYISTTNDSASTNNDNVGLFSTSNGAKIYNLTLDNIYVVGGDNVGGLIGKANGGVVENVSVSGKIIGKNIVGGIIGQVHYLDIAIKKCSVSGSIIGATAVGGIAGIVSSKAEMTGLHNFATVTASGELCGGITSKIESGTLSDSFNSGEVRASINAAGLVAVLGGKITRSYNSGAIVATVGVGGIVGANNGVIQMCYNTGSVTGNSSAGLAYDNSGQVISCYSVGVVSGEGSAGLIVVNNAGCRIYDCYYVLSDNVVDIVKNNGIKEMSGKLPEISFILGEVCFADIVNAAQFEKKADSFPRLKNFEYTDQDNLSNWPEHLLYNVAVKYSLEYSLSGGIWQDGYVPTNEYTKGVPLMLPDGGDIVRQGFDIVGWKLGQSVVTQINDTSRGNLSLVAVWQLRELVPTLKFSSEHIRLELTLPAAPSGTRYRIIWQAPNGEQIPSDEISVMLAAYGKYICRVEVVENETILAEISLEYNYEQPIIDNPGGGEGEPGDKPQPPSPPQDSNIFLYVLYGLLGVAAVIAICVGAFAFIRSRKASAYPSSDDGESIDDEPKKIERPVECFTNIKFTMGGVQSSVKEELVPTEQEIVAGSADDVDPSADAKPLVQLPVENTPAVIYSGMVPIEYDRKKADNVSDTISQPTVDMIHESASEKKARLMTKNKNIMNYETKHNGIDGFVDDFSDGNDRK